MKKNLFYFYLRDLLDLLHQHLPLLLQEGKPQDPLCLQGARGGQVSWAQLRQLLVTEDTPTTGLTKSD